MRDHKETKWTLVVILAAVVAALTTVAVLLTRSRMKKKALSAYNDTIDYDFDDCDCCGEDDCCCAFEKDEPVQIPLAKPEDEAAAAEGAED